MTRLFAALGVVVLLGVIGGGIWLAVSPMQPAQHDVRVELPDNFQR